MWFGSRGSLRHAVLADDLKAGKALTGILGDRLGAREIGRRFLAAEPAEADGSVRWAAQILRNSAPGSASLRAAVRTSRERDFRLGNIVVIDGWVLARSEARLCAIAAVT